VLSVSEPTGIATILALFAMLAPLALQNRVSNRRKASQIARKNVK
jgi:hypothetical protein